MEIGKYKIAGQFICIGKLRDGLSVDVHREFGFESLVMEACRALKSLVHPELLFS